MVDGLRRRAATRLRAVRASSWRPRLPLGATVDNGASPVRSDSLPGGRQEVLPHYVDQSAERQPAVAAPQKRRNPTDGRGTATEEIDMPLRRWLAPPPNYTRLR